jgi:O-acetyl-ADP-ribose deacetylase (regulator of RNase III)
MRVAMIQITEANLLQAQAEALVNAVNCVGYMGKGIALQFKQAFPANFRQYESACKAGEVQPGRMLIHDNGRLALPHYIINFPTKRHWRMSSQLADIRDGLEEVQVQLFAPQAAPTAKSLPVRSVRGSRFAGQPHAGADGYGPI